MLETNLHEDNCFLTLTYEDPPKIVREGHDPLHTLMRKDYVDFLKRLRKKIEPLRFRYFVVGEYGDETFRPHYHAALFGFPGCLRGITRQKFQSTRSDWANCCSICRMVGETWGLGDIQIGTLETASARYLAGYVTKKMTMRDDPRLEGREPEFARMSLRPGIGHDFMYEVASSFMLHNLEQTEGDVPSTLRHGESQLPLGRYLTKKLRNMVGRDEKAPQSTIDKIQEELQGVRQNAFDNSVSFSSALAAHNKPLVASFKARQRIFKRGKAL